MLTSRTTLLILASLMVLTLADCRCSKPRQTKPDAAPAKKKVTKLAPRHFPSRALRKQMAKLQRFTEELRRRARRGKLGGAAKVVAGILAQVPTAAAPKTFVTRLAGTRKLAQALHSSQQPARDYGLLIESCVSCHREHAPGLLGLVTRLRLEPPAKAEER